MVGLQAGVSKMFIRGNIYITADALSGKAWEVWGAYLKSYVECLEIELFLYWL